MKPKTTIRRLETIIDRIDERGKRLMYAAIRSGARHEQAAIDLDILSGRCWKIKTYIESLGKQRSAA